MTSKPHVALIAAFPAHATPARSVPICGLVVEALSVALPPGVHTLLAQNARHHPLLVVRVRPTRVRNAVASPLMNLAEVQQPRDTNSVALAIQQELRGGCFRLNDDIVNLHRGLRELEAVPTMPLIPRKETVSCLVHHVGHDQQAAVIPKLIDPSAFVNFPPIGPAVPRHVRVGVLPSRAQVRPNVATAHNDPHRIQVGVHRGKRGDLCKIMQVEPAVGCAARDILPQRVYFRSSQVEPLPAAIKRDHRGDVILRRRAGGQSPASSGPRRPQDLRLRHGGESLCLLLVLPGRERTAGSQAPRAEGAHCVRLGVCGRTLNGLFHLLVVGGHPAVVCLVAVRDVDAVQVHDLLEGAESGVPHVPSQRQGEVYAAAV
mmetsp:Transcript_145909/g.406418  ORF Transcript_145909/g.406418 Transcript_145909/m.406418 type:complete len:374 (-) Transcript_145909:1008-2129(-)